MSETVSAGPVPAGDPPSLGLMQRAVAVYASPARAWGGLREHVQWWFPLLIVLVIGVAGLLGTFQHVMIPMLSDMWDRQIADGKMTAEQADKALQFMGGPLGMVFVSVQQTVVVTLYLLFTALVIWFGTAFVMGGRMTYRLSLEVAAWSSLLSIPMSLLTFVLAWNKQSYQGLHLGFGAFLPEVDPPTKLMTGLGVLLDALGPLQVWVMAVSILGAAAISGLPRKRVAWTLGALFLVQWIISAVLGAMFTPGT